MAKQLFGKTIPAKLAIAVTSVTMTLGGWAVFAVNDAIQASQAAQMAPAQGPAGAPTGSTTAKKATKPAHRAGAAPPKPLRVVTAPIEEGPPAPSPLVIMAVTRSSR